MLDLLKALSLIKMTTMLVAGLCLMALPSLASEDHFCITGILEDGSETRTGSFPSTGNVNGLVVLVHFPELDGTFPLDLVEFEAFLNQDGYSANGNNGSVHDYFEDVSCGELNFTNTLYPHVYTPDEPRSYYCEGNANYPDHVTRDLAREIILWLDNDPDFDFSEYDSNSDLVIDSFQMVAQGTNYCSISQPNFFSGLRPHFWSIGATINTNDGIKVENYAISLYGFRNSVQEIHNNYPTLSHFCHESGHFICGWKDYYLLVEVGTSDARGHLGDYCLMGTGANFAGENGDEGRINPCHPNAYLKKTAGWIIPNIFVEDPEVQEVQAIHETCDAGLSNAGLIPHPTEGNRDSYIVENRQASGRDSNLLESGLAIYRVRYPYSGAIFPYIELVQADGGVSVPYFSGNLYRAPDATLFDYRSNPSPKWEDGTPCGLAVSAISLPGNEMTYDYFSHEMVAVTLRSEPRTTVLYWDVIGPDGLYHSSGMSTATDEAVLGLGKSGVYTITYSSPYYSSPRIVEVDLSAVQGNSLVVSLPFDPLFVAEASGDLGDNSNATTVCTIKFNDDPWDDLFIGNADGRNLLLLGDGSGGFQEDSAPDILANAVGVKHAAWGDIDNDGDPDVFLVRGEGEHLLLENESETMIDITSESSLPVQGEISSVAWVDVTGAEGEQGTLDCFIVRTNSNNELYEGDGTGGFVLGDAGDAGGAGFLYTQYSQWCDYREDGWPSVLVCSGAGPNKLFRNIEGTLTGPEEVFPGSTWELFPSAEVAWGDFDQDGDPDLIRLSRTLRILEFWRQDSAHNFSMEVISSVPDAGGVTSINLVDVNNDKYLDVFMTVLNGCDLLYLYDPHLSPGFHQIFLDHLPETAGRSVASSTIDANGDGAMDLYVVCDGESNYLLYNNFYEPGNWIGFDLESTIQNASAVGARVKLFTGGDSLSREVSFSGGPGQNSSIVHFGIGDENSDRVAYVYWGGETEPTLLTGLATNQVHRIFEIGISEVAEYPILSGGSNNAIFAVHVEHGGSASVNVQADLTPLGGLSGVALLDNGVAPDITEGDGFFTSAPFSSSVTAGQYSVEVTVSGVFALPTDRSVSVEVIESQLLLVDGSDDTDDLNLLSGEPYAGIYFDSPVDGIGQDILMISKDSSSVPEIFRHRGSFNNGSPEMEKKSEVWFPVGVEPSQGSRGVFAADFDNDGDEDLFICHNNQETRLYENTGNGFSDVTTMFGGNESLLNGAHVAAWGDYNQDGKLDLFVATMNYTGSMTALADNIGTVTNSQWFLFKNTGTSFELALDSMYTTGGFALSASWNDVNNDGLLDLVVGGLQGGANGSPTVILNQGYKKTLGHYLLTEDPGTAHINGLTVNSLDWIDYDHNNLPDLVVTEFAPSFGAHILRNTGNGFEVAVTLTNEGSWTGSVVADFNQDGQDDVVLLPLNGMPALFVWDQAANTYKELAYPLGLRQGATSGGFAADFNNDKDMDLYLGRANTDQFLYKNHRVNGNDPVTGDQDWIRFDLTTMGNSNASLIGARITVVGDTKQWIQTVDGGSGRGGQRSNELHFGLGNATGSVDVILDWPGSIPPNPITYSSLAINTVHAIADTARPHVIVGSPGFLHEPSPKGTDWVFEWRTVEHGNIELDKVEIDFGGYFPGDYCYVGLDVILEFDTPDVDMTIFPVLPSGWKHRVVWSNQSCLGDSICGFQFKVGSGVESPQGVQTLTEGSWVNFGEFDVCITKKSITN